MANLGQLKRDMFRAINEQGDLIRLRNRSKLVEGKLFAIVDFLKGAKSITLYFKWREGVDFYQKSQNFNFFSFFYNI